MIQFEALSKIGYQLKNSSFQNLILTQILKIGGGVRSFYFGLILSPHLAWIAKNGYLWVKYKPFLLSLPLANNIPVSEDYTKLESGVERRRRMNNSMEWSGSLVFAEDSNSLSIYDLAWNVLQNTLVIAHERDMIKGIIMSYVGKTSKEIPRIKNI